ncbi:Protein of unknown function [Pyronema omphalodes CBS 100304]|uniref:Uncharacterized protein n=1 Tax=Pyronema omphalodes (strain CBS 100304) TaxID=1076935 RepID=U4L7M4_PYROM|nr:Protein of unknown function [Pyronema omphalodes CBS 100304]
MRSTNPGNFLCLEQASERFTSFAPSSFSRH